MKIEFTRTMHPAGRSVEEPERAPMLLSAEEVRRLEERILHHSADPMEERLRAGDCCYAILSVAGEVGSFAWAVSGREVCVHKRSDRRDARGIVANLLGLSIKCCETWTAYGKNHGLPPNLRQGRFQGLRLLAGGGGQDGGGVLDEPWIGDF